MKYTPNNKSGPETLKCKKCKKPSNFEHEWIRYTKSALDNVDIECSLKCTSCKEANLTALPYKSEHIQKNLLKLCN